MKNIYKYNIKEIDKTWMMECYYYESFSSFLREVYNISESTYMKYMRAQEKESE